MNLLRNLCTKSNGIDDDVTLLSLIWHASRDTFFYLISPIRQISYSLCNPRATHNGELEVISCPIPISIMQFMIQEWSKLPSEIQASKSLADFKQKLIA